jgi:hypothetical protein
MLFPSAKGARGVGAIVLWSEKAVSGIRRFGVNPLPGSAQNPSFVSTPIRRLRETASLLRSYDGPTFLWLDLLVRGIAFLILALMGTRDG